MCARVEGFRPRLYFALTERWTPVAIRDVLNREKRDPKAILYETVERTHMYDFEPDEATASGRVLHAYLEASFPSLQTYRKICSGHTPYRKSRDKNENDDRAAAAAAAAEGGGGEEDLPELIAHEAKVEPLTRFLLDTELRPGSWCRLSRFADAVRRVTTCDVEVDARLEEVGPCAERTLPAPYVTCYYDIETLGLKAETAAVIQVSLVPEVGAALDRHVVCLGTVDPSPRSRSTPARPRPRCSSSFASSSYSRTWISL